MFKNVSANWIRLVVALGVNFFLFRFVLDTLGIDLQGSWTVILSVTTFLALMVLGVPMASVRYFSEAIAREDDEELNRAIGSCGVLYLGIGLLALLASAGLYLYYDAVYIQLAGDDHSQSLARQAFWIVTVFIATGFFAQLPYGVMAAKHDFVQRNVVLTGSLLLRLILTVVLLPMNKTLPTLAGILLFCQCLEFLVGWRWMLRLYPGVRLSLRDFDRAMVKRIFGFSMFVLILNLGIKLAYSTDSQVIGAFSPKDVALGQTVLYAPSNTLLVSLVDLLIAIGSVVMPMATRLKTQGKTHELGGIFLKWSKIAFAITVPAACYLLVRGPDFLLWWLTDEFKGEAGAVLRILMVSSLFFLPVRGVALPILMGVGRMKAITISFLVMGVINVGISILLIRSMGIRGVALGTAIPNILFAIIALFVACKEVEIPVSRYLRHVASRMLLTGLLCSGVLIAFQVAWPGSSFGSLFVSGLVMMGVFGLSCIFFVYRGDPDLDLHAKLMQRLGKGGNPA